MSGHNSQFLWPTATKQRFLSFSCLGELDDTQVLTVGPFFHREQGVKRKLMEFFQNMQLFSQCIAMLYTEKSVLHYYVWFSQIRSQINLFLFY